MNRSEAFLCGERYVFACERSSRISRAFDFDFYLRCQVSVGLDAHICQVRLLALAQERGQRGPSQKLDMCALCADKRAFCARIQL